MRFLVVAILCFFWVCPVQAKHKHHEKYYQEKHCQGTLEYKLPDRTRVDCLTDEYAIEFEFASKWAEAVGQSLYYGLKTSKKPMIALIVESVQDLRYINRVREICDMYGIALWIIEE